MDKITDNTVRDYKFPLDYTITTVPVDRQGTKSDYFVPVIVERNQSRDLSEVIANAIDRGLIAGLKTSAAREIAEGVMQQIYAEFKDGNGVSFGKFFSARLYLTGKIGESGRLDKDVNSVNVRMIAGPEYDLDIGDYRMRFVSGKDAPAIDWTSYDGSTERNVIKTGENMQLVGRNFISADGVNASFTAKNGIGAETPLTIVSISEFTATLEPPHWLASYNEAELKVVTAGGMFATKTVKVVH